MSAETERLKEAVVRSGYVLDGHGIHHELTSGMHGQKLDFDKVPDEDPLYDQWTETAADFISEEFPNLPEIIIGVAKGTNRTALDTARRFDGEVLGLTTYKDAEKQIHLTELAGKAITAMHPELVVVLEDVGTRGTNSVQAATACRDAGAQSVEVVTTWQRRPVLERLEEAGVPYRAMINEELPAYSPEDCREHGFCSQGWEFVERN